LWPCSGHDEQGETVALLWLHPKGADKDLQRGLEEMPALLADLPSGFHLLVDLGRLESMEPACSTQIGKVMELCDPARRGTGGPRHSRSGERHRVEHAFHIPLPAPSAGGHL